MGGIKSHQTPRELQPRISMALYQMWLHISLLAPWSCLPFPSLTVPWCHITIFPRISFDSSLRHQVSKFLEKMIFYILYFPQWIWPKLSVIVFLDFFIGPHRTLPLRFCFSFVLVTFSKLVYLFLPLSSTLSFARAILFPVRHMLYWYRTENWDHAKHQNKDSERGTKFRHHLDHWKAN